VLAVALSFLDRLGYVLFQAHGGMLGDVFGPRRVLTLTLAFWSALTVITAWTYRAWTFAAIRFLIGIGESPALTNANRVVASWMRFRTRQGQWHVRDGGLGAC
jgi:MFS family permease